MPLTIDDYKKIHKDTIELINNIEDQIEELKIKKK